MDNAIIADIAQKTIVNYVTRFGVAAYSETVDDKGTLTITVTPSSPATLAAQKFTLPGDPYVLSIPTPLSTEGVAK